MDRTADASGDDILVSLVGPDGTVRRSGILVSASAADQQQQAIAGNGSEFLATWVEIRAGLRFIVAARLTSDGATLDPAGILLTQRHVTNSSPFPAVASDGSGFLVVWEEFGKQGLTDIFGARIAADGTLLDPHPIVVNDAPDYQFVPAVTWNGSSYLVVFGDQRGVRGARVAADGTVLDPAGFQIGPSLGYLPSVVAGSSNALVVWEGSSLDVGVFGARVAPDGTVLDPTPISIGPSTYTRPAVASNGDGFLVAWSGRRGGSSFRVFGNRIDAAGTVLDGRGFVIAGGTTFQAVPALDWDGRTYVVAFERPTHGASIDVLLRRVGADGSLVGRTVPVAVGPDDETGPVGAAGGPGESSVLYLRRATEAPYGGAERAFDRIVTEAA
jgi:hypothetical protein